MKRRHKRMIISVHVPKCAGTSLLQLFKEEYPGRVHGDYEEVPLDPECLFQKNLAAWRESINKLNAADFRETDVIHGHFWAGKYDGLFRSPLKITWLRDPVLRLVSHYYYWKGKESLPNSLHRLVHQNGFSVADFAELPIMQNVYTRTFLRGIRIDQFDFVGVHEHFEADLACLSERLGWTRRIVPRENRTTHPEYAAQALDPDLNHRIRKLNAEDIDLYARALQLRARRASPRKFFFWPFAPAATRFSAG